MTRAQRALWSAKSVGLEVESIATKEVKTGSKHNAKMVSDEQQENTATGLDSLFKRGKGKIGSNFISFRQIFCWRLVLS